MKFKSAVTAVGLVLPLFISWHLEPVLCRGNVGCLFSSVLCETGEDCFDDNAFGRCLGNYDPDEEFYRHVLGADTMRLLEKELARLFVGGYRWNHQYTQCVVQNILYSKRHSVSYDPGLCARILELTLPSVPDDVEEKLLSTEPDEMAFVKFTPYTDDDDDDGNSVYAAEYFTPQENSESSHDDFVNEDGRHYEFGNVKNRYSKRVEVDEAEGRSSASRYMSEIDRGIRELLNHGTDQSDSNNESKLPLIQADLSPAMNHRPAFSEGGIEWVPVGDHVGDMDDDDVPNFTDGSIGEKEKKTWIQTDESPDGIKLKDVTSSLKKPPDDDGIEDSKSPEESNFVWNKREKNGFEEDLDKWTSPDVTQNGKYDRDPSEDGDNVLPTFERSMRYDTKKPGPSFPYHGEDSSEERRDQMEQRDISILESLMEEAHDNQLHSVLQPPVRGTQSDVPLSDEDGIAGMEKSLNDLLLPVKSYGFSNPTSQENKPVLQNDMPRVPTSEVEKEDDIEVKRAYHRPQGNQQEVIEGGKTNNILRDEDKTADVARTGEGHIGRYDSVDTNYAYILVKDEAASPQDVQKLVLGLEKVLDLPRGTFSNIRVNESQVTFKVNPNKHKLNASDVAAEAEKHSSQLKGLTGQEVASAGIGDKVKFELVSPDNDRRLFILTFVLCGGVVGIMVAVAVAYIIRRHAKSKEKLQNITHPDTEASQDYQDLCRQRMASKTSEKPEPVHVSQSPKKVRSLSQGEGQASSSSHSSTSSWNEEPVTSNMDISTGHMILAYMEDHLTNKDRLDREWEALCAYEAEPCSTSAATLPQNIKKNRYTGILPYDHSRVILNELSNVSGSDYINASTITDHDPRNPAYIATQGPLPHTAADFWQMIWEQGSVVIVMLTRLMENGVAMCHRYWPEEGSDVYHIYEVHLVSEHIWCDDFLVRSFYLKNLRTGETRTVTQFHFLSWPDNGVPNSTKALLEFRRKVNKSYRGRSCPIVVHCSDGIGRTGTYCLIDMVLNRMAKGAKEIDIAATLEHVRDQRGGMVKTKAQFEFVLMAIAEEVHAILKALSQ